MSLLQLRKEENFRRIFSSGRIRGLGWSLIITEALYMLPDNLRILFQRQFFLIFVDILSQVYHYLTNSNTNQDQSNQFVKGLDLFPF